MPQTTNAGGPSCGGFFRYGEKRLLWLIGILTCWLEAKADVIDPAAFRLMRPPVEKLPHKPDDSLLSDTNQPISAVFYRSSFSKWKHYTDERVEFEYPDDPALTLELVGKESEQHVPIAGSPMRTVRYRPEKVYRIQAGGVTWAVLLWSEDNWFDDGICLCGEVVLRAYLAHQGGFYALSFLPDGKVKQVQCLGEKSRLILFESTHLPMAQSDYVRMARSLKIKRPIQLSAAGLQAKTIERYGFVGRLGWLRVGMPASEIELLLGPPKLRRSTGLTYEKADAEWQTVWHLPIKSGKLQVLKDGFVASREVPPKEGTLRWFGKQMEPVMVTGRAGMPHKVPPVRWQRSFFEAFVREAPRSSAEDWNLWCQNANALHDKGFVDSRIVPIVKGRFLEPIRQHYARCVLDDYDNAGSQELFKQRLNLCTQAANKFLIEDKEDEDAHASLFEVWDDVSNLLSGVPRAERNVLLPKLLEHPHPRIRGDACQFLGDLPEPQRTAYARTGLNDPDSWVRVWSANAITEGAGSTTDLPRLKQLLASDKDYFVQQHVKEAIARLEKLP